MFCVDSAAGAVPLAAQEFGFGSDDDSDAGVSGSSGGALAVSIGGEVSASLLGYVDDFSDGPDAVRLGDVFSGELDFSAGNSFAEGVINLKLNPAFDGGSPVTIDEAYVTAYFGQLDVEAGLRKLAWGKADSPGPLDVINPLDSSDLTTMSEVADLKIARPLVHLSLRLGQFSKLETVFVPSFEPTRFAESGRWAPPAMAAFSADDDKITVTLPDTSTLDYAQAGVRFTTTVGSADFGFQYYYGRKTSPAVTTTKEGEATLVHFAYNPYHQIGVDWAQVLLGFNTRAEAAINLTGDLDGDDPGVYNPSVAWSLGFDRDVLWGINVNLQCDETIRLMDGEIESDRDIEADSDVTNTRLTVALSKKFFRDELEVKAAAVCDIEARDFLFMPGVVWTRDALSAELSAGIFGGDEDGPFGQYGYDGAVNNSFVKVTLTYSF